MDVTRRGDSWATVPLDSDLFGNLMGPASRLLDLTGIDDPGAEPEPIRVVVSGHYGDIPAIWHGIIKP